ncbi:putative periplasmic solute-binding protein [Gottschalkia purinilytica]|uniref:Putative periplasmic solute-binding protein n=1 Tax=Gottschalkia purinilytica TaxID=1503 RepID=A0A0L0WES8_GOTPU|nr:endolytic transglycosylase MltG [Gottschalkia purinilytica]KNF09959.1 putative periplasmic solute-binding protein [Gottschalkia purinilytica]
MKQNKNGLYLILLGVGIGFVITSLLSTLFTKPKYVEYSEEEIIQKARDLGMVSLKEKIEKNEKNEKKEINNSKKDTTEEVINKEKDIKNNYIKFTINPGDTSDIIVKNLHSKGIVEDKEKLSQMIIGKNLQRKFQRGTYTVSKDMSYEQLISILTQINY